MLTDKHMCDSDVSSKLRRVRWPMGAEFTRFFLVDYA